MISRSLYFQLIFRVLLLVLIAMAAGTCIALKGPISLVVILLMVEIVVVANLTR